MEKIKKIFNSFVLFLLFGSNVSLPAEANKDKQWYEISKEAKNAVVQIFSELKNINWLKPCEPPVESACRGSGFFVDDQGHIVTNYHVVKQANPVYIQIPSLGKDRFEVEIIGCHPDKDVAVLKLKQKSFNDLLNLFKNSLGVGSIPSLNLGDSDNLVGAQEIMAKGYPLGQENQKDSLGHIAGPQHINGRNLMQTTAPVNSGNSGGPFFDKNGKVIGIVVTNIPSAQNVGYFIPIDDVKNVIKGFIDNKYERKFLDKNFWGAALQPTTEDTLKFLGFNVDGGARVSKVIKDSTFDKKGIKKGDVVYKVRVGDQELKVDRFGYVNVDWCQDKVTVYDMISRLDIGQEFTVSVYRKTEKNVVEELDFDFVVDAKNEMLICEKYPEFEDIDYEVFAGMVVMQLTQNHLDILKEAIKITAQRNDLLWLCDLLKYENPESKNKYVLVITHIYGGSAVADARCIDEWDIVSKVNDKKVTSLEEFRDAVKLSKETEHFTIETKDGSYAAIPMEKVLEKEELLSFFNPFAKSKLLDDIFRS